MPRRRRPETREIVPDPVYNSALAEKFVNSMMWDGKKAVSQRIFYDAMDKIKERSQDDPLKLFKKAVENCKPLLEVKTRRVGGANYQVPVEVAPARRTALALRWLKEAAQGRNEKDMSRRLSAELIQALNNEGNAVKKKQDIHRMAESNKAFAHFRW